eukprot:6943013-Prorocentrum_lima.AAC.1
MTSSLVGSEMCIRDRLSHVPCWTDGSRFFTPCKGWHPPLPLAAASPHAVSYTHLTLPTICSV